MAASGPDRFDTWLASVECGQATMTQRAIGWAERNGGLDDLVARARSRGIHLARLTDDKGHALVIASREPFKTLC